MSLVLHRETLCSLSHEDLDQVDGGITPVIGAIGVSIAAGMAAYNIGKDLGACMAKATW